MRIELTEDQKLAVSHLINNKKALLFMECGSGKTAACLSAIDLLVAEGAIKAVLIVAPIRVAKLTWPNEIRKWDNYNWMRVLSLRNINNLGNHALIYTVNYEKLPALSRKLKKLEQWPFNAVIWDELTMAKNHASKRVNSVRTLFQEKLNYHWGLTGTPIPRGYTDLFAQVRLIDKGKRLFHKVTQFRDRWCKTIRFKHFVDYRVPRYNEPLIEKRIKDITLTIRHNKHEIIEKDVYVTLPLEARKVYDQLEQKLIATVKGEDIDAKSKGVLISKLRQIASGSVYSTSLKNKVLEIHNAKLTAFRKLRISGNALVAYNFRHELDTLLPYTTAFLNKNKSEQETCDLWNKGEIKYLAVHPSSVSHGLNLQYGGNTVIWYSLTYNREHYEQLYSRLARTGQKNRVIVYRIVAKDTIDEVVLEALASKGNVQESLLTALKTYIKIK